MAILIFMNYLRDDFIKNLQTNGDEKVCYVQKLLSFLRGMEGPKVDC